MLVLLPSLPIALWSVIFVVTPIPIFAGCFIVLFFPDGGLVFVGCQYLSLSVKGIRWDRNVTPVNAEYEAPMYAPQKYLLQLRAFPSAPKVVLWVNTPICPLMTDLHFRRAPQLIFYAFSWFAFFYLHLVSSLGESCNGFWMVFSKSFRCFFSFVVICFSALWFCLSISFYLVFLVYFL